MKLANAAWLATVGACLFAAVMLFISGYSGYAVVIVAVACAAAINIRTK